MEVGRRDGNTLLLPEFPALSCSRLCSLLLWSELSSRCPRLCCLLLRLWRTGRSRAASGGTATDPGAGAGSAGGTISLSAISPIRVWEGSFMSGYLVMYCRG